VTVTRKWGLSPVFTGLFCTVLLIVSRFISLYPLISSRLGAVNTVIIIVALCECVHLVRGTSAMFYNHVWNNIPGTILFAMPVSNLLVTAIQLFFNNQTVMLSAYFTGFLTLVSLPAFFCYYFTFYIKNSVKNNSWLKNAALAKVLTTVLPVMGALYTLIRFLDKSLFPYLGTKSVAVPEILAKIVSCSSSVSFGMYFLAAAGFVIMGISAARKKSAISNEQ
jgi:hypothetical protein